MDENPQKPEGVELEARATDKIRVQFDFTPDALQRLDELKEVTCALTRAEVIRDALSLYEWFVNETQPEYTLKLFNEKNEVVSAFRAELLRRV